MKFAVAIMALVFVVGCSNKTSGNGNPAGPGPGPKTPTKVAADGTSPKIVGGVVQYDQKAGQEPEAWEIEQLETTKIYLNYSRFQFGTPQYNGKNTMICGASIGGVKYIGVGEAEDRLTAAMITVINPAQGDQGVFGCKEYTALIAEHKELKTLDDVFNALK